MGTGDVAAEGENNNTQNDVTKETLSDTEPRSKGARQKKKKRRYHIDVFRAWCKQCGICVAFCPVEALGQDEAGYAVAKNPEACIGCMQCELRCPDFAITVSEDEAGKDTSETMAA
jgi:2-oxoglutarate ferredoxin oxidoreductase subunit delta